MVADQTSGDVITLDVGVPTLQGDDGMSFYALDRGVAYVRGAAGAVSVDVATGEQQVVDAGATSFEVLGANDGLVAFAGTSDEDGSGAVLLGPTRAEADVTIDALYGSTAYFSPDGGSLIIEGDVLAVFDTASGDELDFALPEFSAGVGWLDETTLLAIQLTRDDKTMQVLACSVETITCEITDPAVVPMAALRAGEYVFASGSDFSPDRN